MYKCNLIIHLYLRRFTFRSTAIAGANVFSMFRTSISHVYPCPVRIRTKFTNTFSPSYFLSFSLSISFSDSSNDVVSCILDGRCHFVRFTGCCRLLGWREPEKSGECFDVSRVTPHACCFRLTHSGYSAFQFNMLMETETGPGVPRGRLFIKKKIIKTAILFMIKYYYYRIHLSEWEKQATGWNINTVDIIEYMLRRYKYI